MQVRGVDGAGFVINIRCLNDACDVGGGACLIGPAVWLIPFYIGHYVEFREILDFHKSCSSNCCLSWRFVRGVPGELLEADSAPKVSC